MHGSLESLSIEGSGPGNKTERCLGIMFTDWSFFEIL